ncbi:MAG: hypothetical protein U9N35_04570 [Euryarchaeota archaeon]|nr:hypothetical protein [Euryarchaeota archaeon]
MDKKLIWVWSFLIIILLLLSQFSFITVEERIENQGIQEYGHVKEKDLSDLSVIKMGYTAIFLTEFDIERSEKIFDRLVEVQKENGEINDNINAKLCTGLCVFSLIEGYKRTDMEKYKKAALKGGKFLINEIEDWKEINKIKITEISKNARHGGKPQSSLECYYWTSPNDLGIMALGIAALVPYDKKYREYAEELGDALWKMQLKNGGWYDGYTRIPIRRDQSSWYAVMAMLGLWQCYKNTENERYKESLIEAQKWFETLWNGGSVYDILAYKENYEAALSEGRVIGSPEGLKFDYKRYEETNKRDYVVSSDYTNYYGEHSFLLAASLLTERGMEKDRRKLKNTFAYIMETKEEDPSNWFLLSLWLMRQRKGA